MRSYNRTATVEFKIKGYKMTNAQLIEAVKAHALEKYEQPGGWDFVIECWSDEEIGAEIAGAKTALGAVRKMSAAIGPIAEQRGAVRNEIF